MHCVHAVRVCDGGTGRKYDKNVRQALCTVRVCGDGTCSKYGKNVRHVLCTVIMCGGGTCSLVRPKCETCTMYSKSWGMR